MAISVLCHVCITRIRTTWNTNRSTEAEWRTRVSVNSIPDICLNKGFLAWSTPGHYLIQCWNIINWTHRNKFQWNSDRNSYNFIKKRNSKCCLRGVGHFVSAPVLYWSFLRGIHRSQRPVTRSFDVFFDLCPNKRLSKQLWGWLRRHRAHYDLTVKYNILRCLYLFMFIEHIEWLDMKVSRLL